MLKKPGNTIDRPFLIRIILFGSPAPEQGDFQIINAGAELLVVDGLEDIVGDLKPQSFPTVGKIVIARNNNKGSVRNPCRRAA